MSTMRRTLAILVTTAIVLAGCGLNPSDLGGTATARVIPGPTETPTPETIQTKTSVVPTETPTEIPNPYANIDAQNTNTWPDEIKAYYQTGQYPDVVTQERNTPIFLRMYRNLVDKYASKYGFTSQEIDGWDNKMLAFKAGEVALQEGFYLPMDLAITRDMDTGPQAISYRDNQGNLHFGIMESGGIGA